jgi:hypothetical protein
MLSPPSGPFRRSNRSDPRGSCIVVSMALDCIANGVKNLPRNLDGIKLHTDGCAAQD